MRAVVQRVKDARVEVSGEIIGSISSGLLVYLGIGRNDGERDCKYMCEKIAGLRIFEDDCAHMNRSLSDAGGGVLLISQFTLYGDVRKGKRPSFSQAMDPEAARVLFEQMALLLRTRVDTVETGIFQADMQVYSRNDGPVTILLDSEKQF